MASPKSALNPETNPGKIFSPESDRGACKIVFFLPLPINFDLLILVINQANLADSHCPYIPAFCLLQGL